MASDAEHPAHGRDLIERIRKITDKPVKWVINTHAHGDHYYGNPAFKAVGATIIAHRDVVAGMIKNEQLEFKRRLAFFKSLNLDPAEVKTVLPQADPHAHPLPERTPIGERLAEEGAH